MRRIQGKVIVYVSALLLVFASMASAQTGLESPIGKEASRSQVAGVTQDDVIASQMMVVSPLLLWAVIAQVALAAFWAGWPFDLCGAACTRGGVILCYLCQHRMNKMNSKLNPRNYAVEEPGSEKEEHSYLEHLAYGVTAR